MPCKGLSEPPLDWKFPFQRTDSSDRRIRDLEAYAQYSRNFTAKDRTYGWWWLNYRASFRRREMWFNEAQANQMGSYKDERPLRRVGYLSST